jgi:hypothetical protein
LAGEVKNVRVSYPVGIMSATVLMTLAYALPVFVGTSVDGHFDKWKASWVDACTCACPLVRAVRVCFLAADGVVAATCAPPTLVLARCVCPLWCMHYMLWRVEVTKSVSNAISHKLSSPPHPPSLHSGWLLRGHSLTAVHQPRVHDAGVCVSACRHRKHRLLLVSLITPNMHASSLLSSCGSMCCGVGCWAHHSHCSARVALPPPPLPLGLPPPRPVVACGSLSSGKSQMLVSPPRTTYTLPPLSQAAAACAMLNNFNAALALTSRIVQATAARRMLPHFLVRVLLKGGDCVPTPPPPQPTHSLTPASASDTSLCCLALSLVPTCAWLFTCAVCYHPSAAVLQYSPVQHARASHPWSRHHDCSPGQRALWQPHRPGHPVQERSHGHRGGNVHQVQD